MRRGKFYVSTPMLIEADRGYNDTLFGINLFHNLIVVHARQLLLEDITEYMAISPMFRAIQMGEILPTYVAEFYPDSPYPTWREVPDYTPGVCHPLPRLMDREES